MLCGVRRRRHERGQKVKGNKGRKFQNQKITCDKDVTYLFFEFFVCYQGVPFVFLIRDSSFDVASCVLLACVLCVAYGLLVRLGCDSGVTWV